MKDNVIYKTSSVLLLGLLMQTQILEQEILGLKSMSCIYNMVNHFRKLEQNRQGFKVHLKTT